MFVSGSGLIDVWESVGEIGRELMFEEEEKEKVDVEMQAVKEPTKERGLDDGKKRFVSLDGMNEGSFNSLEDYYMVNVVITKMICENNLLGLRFLHELGKRDIPHFLRRGMTEN